MAEAVEKIGEVDIRKFIIKHKYGENHEDWPSGKGATIVLSTVEIYSTKRSSTSIKDDKLTRKTVYKNGEHPNHAEGYFLRDLKDEIETLLADEETKVTKVQAKLVQNYSPCNNYSDDNKSGCADDILQFKESMRKKGINFSLTIKFATFYSHEVKSNREGLKKLLRNDVKLELLQGKDDWKEFLYDETFVNLKLLRMATSEKRKEREKDDVEILNDIKSEASGNKGIFSYSKINVFYLIILRQ